MSKFTYEQQETLHAATKAAAAKDYADMQRPRELRLIEPGMFAAVRQESEEQIRARNVACSPIAAVHIEKCWLGTNTGETGL